MLAQPSAFPARLERILGHPHQRQDAAEAAGQPGHQDVMQAEAEAAGPVVPNVSNALTQLPHPHCGLPVCEGTLIISLMRSRAMRSCQSQITCRNCAPSSATLVMYVELSRSDETPLRVWQQHQLEAILSHSLQESSNYSTAPAHRRPTSSSNNLKTLAATSPSKLLAVENRFLALLRAPGFAGFVPQGEMPFCPCNPHK